MKHPRKWLCVETTAWLSLTEFPHEIVGAALYLVMHEAAGYDISDDDMARRVSMLTARKWATSRDAIMRARKVIINASQVQVRVKRTPLSSAKRAAILKRDGEVCRYCSSTEGPFHIDHMTPVARGGTDRDENLCVACAPCNLRKSSMVWGEKLY